jgi:hypothetical protein
MEVIKMKKYNLHNIMVKAWELFRKGSKTFAECLRKSWAIAKGLISEKPQFTGSVNIDGFQFNLWEKHGLRRIYINNYTGHNKSNRGGYIDLDHGNSIHATGSAKFAAIDFMNTYAF